ncbi:probable E3 SUMO-protein ligase RNF212 [Uloborus diversus]|uniref:probable E3 SUMO-protein ligase RNF212 n=1 Tax=Uloborus diversus TaxID=327109 RepID=UPI0024098E50|nr:probable E3 SUMO-protein ligase RNF212 [Uloborus diversus]
MRLKMDWVHCNNCFLLPDRDKCFFLTSCGHIYCSDCEAQCARGLCKLCGNQCSSLVLSSSMKPDVQMYFTDPDVLLKKKLREIHQITEFQKNHRARLAAYYRKQNIKFRQMRDDFKKILKSIKDLDSERAKLAKENECLKKCLRMPSASSSSKSSNNAAFTPSFGSFENTPPPYTHMNPMFANLFGKLDNSGASSSMSCMPERVSVFSPPTNGKIGSIPDTPSSAFRKMR